MTANPWKGVGEYDALLTLSEKEMRALADWYHVDWSYFTEGPARHFDDSYFCLVSYSRKALALIPFLSLVFGGMYTELPFGEEAQAAALDFADYTLEAFSFKGK